MTQPTETARRIVIEPVTRVEGHGKVTILLDEQRQVTEARLHIVEFRGFERFIQGRPYWEAPVLVQRLCGICPVSHLLAASKALDRLVGADQLTPTAEKIRRLMHHGQIFQSHALHFFHLASPDLLLGFDADPAQRNIVGLAQREPELARQGIALRRFGQEVIQATAGKRIHGTGAIPGGVNKSLTAGERDRLRQQVDQMITWGVAAMNLSRDYLLENLEALGDFGSFPSNHLSLVRSDGALDLYDGRLRAVDAEGRTIFSDEPAERYAKLLVEQVKSWSYMKFPYIRSLGPERGWYRVGPLSRMATCRFIPTPLAEAARQEFVATWGGRPSPSTLAYHWARMIELVHAGEVIRELLDDPEISGDDLVVTGTRRYEAVGIIEAPRGTLFHHYRINNRDQITMANLIVSTTSNNEPMNRAIGRVARQYLQGVELTEGLLNRIEVAIRAYDPCLSCATHAVGSMPLEVTLVDATGTTVARRVKDAR